MNRFEFYKGMYCSRKFAQWMIRKNEQDTDIPAKTYHKLIRMYCRANYNEFFSEEERKGNDFYYTLMREGDRIWLKSTYELVFLPYEAEIKEFPVEKLEKVEEFVPGYRILQTRGYMPGSTKKAFELNDYFSMESLVAQMSSGLQDSTVNDEQKRIDDIFRAEEFQQAEMRKFIDNDPPCSFGPECPDKIICYQMFNRIIRNMMNELEQLNIVDAEDSENYELKLIAYAAAILDMVLPENYELSQGLLIDDIKEKSDFLFNKYCANTIGSDLKEMCDKIREERFRDVRVIVDCNAVLQYDFDYCDIEEAPIGLTEADYKFGFHDIDETTIVLATEDIEEFDISECK